MLVGVSRIQLWGAVMGRGPYKWPENNWGKLTSLIGSGKTPRMNL